MKGIETDVLLEKDYDPFGMLMVGRSFESGSGYRYGFNGKENDDEIAGNNNDLDFGARMYDSRIGRWMSCDGKLGKYPSQSPYHFGYNNPIITIDPNGDENVIVIGGKDEVGRDKFKFMNSGLKAIHDLHRAEPDESLTVLLIITPSMTQSELAQFNRLAKRYGATNVIRITEAGEITNYLNSKDVDNDQLTDARKDDLVTDVKMFGHGHQDDDKDGDGKGDGPTFEGGHGWAFDELEPGYNYDDEVDRNDMAMQRLSWGIDDVEELNPDAFNSPTWDIESCGSAGTNYWNLNLTEKVAEQTNGLAYGWDGRVEYINIYSQKTDIKKYIDGKIIKADYNPSAGQTYDKSKDASKKSYDYRDY